MQGIYKVKNKNKYVGDVNNIVYRSSWELKYLTMLDNDERVLEFSSEETIIPYYGIDNRLHRYFVDFKIKRLDKDNNIITELVEIKPYHETIPPVLTESQKMRTKLRQVVTWETNQRKWEQARKYCEKQGWQFRLVTENDIPGIIKKLKR